MSKIQFVSPLAAGLLAFAMFSQPGRLQAQATASIHGHVQNAAGQAVNQGEVKLTHDKNPSSPTAKFEYDFPVDSNGDYKGSGITAGNYIAVFFEQGHTVDFMPAPMTAGQDVQVDFDMTRPEYINHMTPEERQQLEEFKKKNAAVTAANAKITNLNNLLKQARADIAAKKYDDAIKAMTDATTAKPDEPILWDTLGDAQLEAANEAFNAAHAAHTTDASLASKYEAARTSYEKAISLNNAAAKPNPAITAAAENQLGQVLGRESKPKEAAAAYDAAAKADPSKAGMYYFNEAATLFNVSDMDDAAIAADKAIAADPTKADAYYIKGQALIRKATVDPKTQKVVAPPDCVEAYRKYLELAPNGPHAEEIKGILQGIGESIETKYKATKKKR